MALRHRPARGKGGNACANDIETHSEEKLEKPKKFGNSEESAEGGIQVFEKTVNLNLKNGKFGVI